MGFTRIDLRDIIRSKNPALLKIIPGFLLRKLERIVHINEMNDLFENTYDHPPFEFVEEGLRMFGAKIIVKGRENLPEKGRFIFTANHPLGGLDGGVFVKAVHDVYGGLKFPVNDILLNMPSMREIFLPINKHGANTRDAFRAIEEAYQSDNQILYFPAGLCSRKIKGKIVDLDWKKSIVTQAIKFQRDVVPVHINGKNSNFFYNLSNIRKALGIKANIEMLYLVDEMYKQKDKEIIISFAKPIPWQQFDHSKSIGEWVEFLRMKTYSME